MSKWAAAILKPQPIRGNLPDGTIHYSTEGHFIKGASSERDVPRLTATRQQRMDG